MSERDEYKCRAEIAEKALEDKDAILEEKDAIIAQLRARLGEK